MASTQTATASLISPALMQEPVATHCEAWSAQLAVTPDTGAIAIPTTATSGAAPAVAMRLPASPKRMFTGLTLTLRGHATRVHSVSTHGVRPLESGKKQHYCPEQQFFATAAPWTVPQQRVAAQRWWCLYPIPKLQHACFKLEHRPRIGLAQPHGYHNCGHDQSV